MKTALALLCCLLTSCYSPPWTVSRSHDLRQGGLRGTVSVSPANPEIAGHLARSGLTPVSSGGNPDWTFVWQDRATQGSISSVTFSAGSARFDRLYRHVMFGFLGQRPGKTRWSGYSLEVWGHAGTEKTAQRRMQRLMEGFPGTPGKNEG